MSFRRRIALLAGAAVAATILLASVLSYVAIRDQLRGQIDDSVTERAQEFASQGGPRGGLGPGGRPGLGGPAGVGAGPPGFLRPPGRAGGTDFYEQRVDPDGTRRTRPGTPALPVDDAVLEVAAGRRGAYVTDATVDGDPVRLAVAPLPAGGAIEVARSLREVDEMLERTRLILFVVALGGVLVAALLGRLVAGRAIEPLRRLTATAEHVAETGDLDRRIDLAGRDDEIGRLAARFNAMLDALQASMRALDASVTAQRQLVADASHELRTPVTSLRTNIEVLQANPDLDPARRATLLDRAAAQTEELTVLCNQLIDLARGEAVEERREPVRLDELVEDAVERARRHAPGTRFDVDVQETTVTGAPDRLAKAINNLLDNAVKWNAPGSPIDVRLRDGELVVRDRGPGFDPAELEHVFDRFFRGAASRDRSGSGLGLAIVRQVAAGHGGSVEAANAPDGGAVVTLRLPPAPPAAAPETPEFQTGPAR